MAYENVELEFNVVGLKIYLGNNIVEKKGSNKNVGLHTDLQFLENGIQRVLEFSTIDLRFTSSQLLLLLCALASSSYPHKN